MDYATFSRHLENIFLYDKTTTSLAYQDPTKNLNKEDRRRSDEKLLYHGTRPVKETPAKPWVKPKVPFDLFLKPKDIIQIDPRDVFKKNLQNLESTQETVQKKPFRGNCQHFPPAKPIDHLNDESRRILIEDMYTSSSQKALTLTTDLSTRNVARHRAPLPCTLSKPNPASVYAIYK